MKTMNFLFIVLTIFATFIACEEKEEPTPLPDKFGEEITLKIGESLAIDEQLNLTFDKVIDDSRCPIGAECIWEGQATVNLRVNEVELIEVIMRAAREELAKDTLNGHIYTLLEVTPYPDLKETLPIPEENYVIKIQVDQL